MMGSKQVLYNLPMLVLPVGEDCLLCLRNRRISILKKLQHVFKQISSKIGKLCKNGVRSNQTASLNLNAKDKLYSV